MGWRDWDRGLQQLLDSEKRIRRDSRLARDDQELLNEYLDAIHTGRATGGIFIREPGGALRYLFVGGPDPLETGADTLIEILRSLTRKR